MGNITTTLNDASNLIRFGDEVNSSHKNIDRKELCVRTSKLYLDPTDSMAKAFLETEDEFNKLFAGGHWLRFPKRFMFLLFYEWPP